MKHSIVIAGLTVLVSVATACWAEKKETSDASANYLEHSIPSEAVKYLSYNVSGFREIFTDDYRKTPVTLKGHLYLPKGWPLSRLLYFSMAWALWKTADPG